MNSLYLYGAGGHAKVIAEIAEECGFANLIFCEDNPLKEFLLGYPVTFKPEAPKNCVISIGSNTVRKKIVSLLTVSFVTLVHPRANVSKRTHIGEGTVIMAGVTINADIKIGKHCIINTNSSVDHDCKIDDYVHLSPNVALAGAVTVGEGTHIGIGACVTQGVKIGRWCTIGAGAVIIKDVPDGATVVGNPGRIIKQNKVEDL